MCLISWIHKDSKISLWEILTSLHVAFLPAMYNLSFQKHTLFFQTFPHHPFGQAWTAYMQVSGEKDENQDVYLSSVWATTHFQRILRSHRLNCTRSLNCEANQHCWVHRKHLPYGSKFRLFLSLVWKDKIFGALKLLKIYEYSTQSDVPEMIHWHQSRKD